MEGADGRLASAEHLQGELRRILEGRNLTTRSSAGNRSRSNRFGGDPDLNDGVRINIRPWITEARCIAQPSLEF